MSHADACLTTGDSELVVKAVSIRAAALYLAFRAIFSRYHFIHAFTIRECSDFGSCCAVAYKFEAPDSLL